MQRRQLLLTAGASAVGVQGLSGSASACEICTYGSRYYKKEGSLVWTTRDKIYGERKRYASAELVIEIRDKKVYGAWAKVSNFAPFDEDFTLKVKAGNEIVGPDKTIIRIPSPDTYAVDFDPDLAEGGTIKMEFPALDSRPIESNGMCGPSYSVVVEGFYDDLALAPCEGTGESISSRPSWTYGATDDAKEHDDDGWWPLW